MHYCTKCGCPLQDTMRFCPRCGLKAYTPQAGPTATSRPANTRGPGPGAASGAQPASSEARGPDLDAAGRVSPASSEARGPDLDAAGRVSPVSREALGPDLDAAGRVSPVSREALGPDLGVPKPAHKVRGVLLTILFWVLLLPLAAIVAVAKSPKLNTPVKLFLIALITGATFLLCSPKQGSPDSGAAGAGASAASPPSSVASASSSFPAQSALPAKALFLRNNFQ